jgi:predicted nucleic acid-binding protein
VAVTHVVVDSGALSALAQGDPRARRTLNDAITADVEITIPAIVIAETTRGTPRDATTNRIISSVHHVPATTESTARRAGRILHAAHSSATADAVIVAEAERIPGSIILTTDPDLSVLAAAHGSVRVVAF